MCKVVCFDLDDTLHKEINYLHAAYRLIAHEVFDEKWEEYYHQMLIWYEEKLDVFQKVVDIAAIGVEKERLLNIYRYDVHSLCLSTEVEDVLSNLKTSGIKLGLITDGRTQTQGNKIKALGLERFFDDDMIVISESFGSEKPSLRNYQYFMDKFPACSNFTYVGDNPQKDFIGANALGWDTVCLLNDGSNIHVQDFDAFGVEYQPHTKIRTLSDLIF